MMHVLIGVLAFIGTAACVSGILYALHKLFDDSHDERMSMYLEAFYKRDLMQ